MNRELFKCKTELHTSRDVEVPSEFPKLPEGAITFPEFKIGGGPQRELTSDVFESEGFIVDFLGSFPLKKCHFKTLAKEENINMVAIKIGDLGYSNYTYDNLSEIYARAQKFGLEKWPEEFAPNIILALKKYPLPPPTQNWYDPINHNGFRIATDPIKEVGASYILKINTMEDGQHFNADGWISYMSWYPDMWFCFKAPTTKNEVGNEKIK